MFKLLLKNKVFSIPTNFCSLNDVRSNIYKELISNQQYEVKSKVHEDLFQLFIDNWVYNKTLDININNFFELVLLSEEFDRIKDLIQIFDGLNQKNNQLLKKNQEFKQKLETKNYNIKNERSNYSKIIHFLFYNNRIGLHSELIDIKSDLFKALKKNDIHLIDLLTRKKFKDKNGLLYVLNEKELTAGLFNNSMINGDVLVPKSITYESQKYLITDIFENAFRFSKSIKSIQFSEQSEIRTIGKNAFFASTLNNIKIPKNVKCIEERAFSFCKQLKSIEFFENSELNSIGSHSFSSSSIECISLPSNIIKVGERAFSECFNLETINFSMNSKLSSIEKQAFSYTSIKHISIPCHVKEIGEYSFAHNNKLKEVEFAKESELVSIGEYAFCSSSIEKLSIPSSIIEFKEGWCCKTINLNSITIIPNKEKNLIYYEDKFILGKSDLKSGIYDILYFSRRDIEKAIIPSFITRISAFAFSECTKLEHIEFVTDSKLKLIDKYSFFNASLDTIKIPSNVEQIEQRAFSCSKIKNIEFSIKSKLKTLGDYSFTGSSIESILIPLQVTKISERSFSLCKKLYKIIIPENSALESIEKYAFYCSSVFSLVVPRNVIKIGDHCFAYCRNLKIIEIEDGSILSTFNKNIFAVSSIKIICVQLNCNYK